MPTKGFITEVFEQQKKAMTAFPDNVLAKEFIDKFFDFNKQYDERFSKINEGKGTIRRN